MSMTSNKTVPVVSSYRGFGVIPSSTGKDSRSTTWLSSSVPLPPLEGLWHLSAGGNPAANLKINRLSSATLHKSYEEALELPSGCQHPCVTTVTLLQSPPGWLRAGDSPGMVPITRLFCPWGFASITMLCLGQGDTFAPPLLAPGY